MNHPGGNLTYQDYASDIREILAYNRIQHKDIMSELNVQFVIADGTFQIKIKVYNGVFNKTQVIGRENHENREWLLTTKYVMQ